MGTVSKGASGEKAACIHDLVDFSAWLPQDVAAAPPPYRHPRARTPPRDVHHLTGYDMTHVSSKRSETLRSHDSGILLTVAKCYMVKQRSTAASSIGLEIQIQTKPTSTYIPHNCWQDPAFHGHPKLSYDYGSFVGCSYKDCKGALIEVLKLQCEGPRSLPEA